MKHICYHGYCRTHPSFLYGCHPTAQHGEDLLTHSTELLLVRVYQVTETDSIHYQTMLLLPGVVPQPGGGRGGDLFFSSPSSQRPSLWYGYNFLADMIVMLWVDYYRMHSLSASLYIQFLYSETYKPNSSCHTMPQQTPLSHYRLPQYRQTGELYQTGPAAAND